METTKTKSDGQPSPEVKKVKGSQALMLSLLEEDVDQIFGYPGGSIMPVYDSLMDYEQKLRHLLTRHEQGAVHAAQGYARATGKTGVVMATSGPGATNLITGIADAHVDSTPLVCITGQVNDGMLGTDAFQEVDIISISAPVTKWSYQITRPEEIPETIAKAFYIAGSGRPGPVLIDLTKNAQFGELDFHYQPCNHIRSYRPVPEIDQQQVARAAGLINQSRQLLALIGQGVILGGAEEELQSFLEKTGIPAASTLLGLSALPASHPNYVGMLGMHGNYGPNILTNEADLLISIGMRFDDRVTGKLSSYGEKARVVHLDIDPAEIDKNVKADAPVAGDVKQTLPLLTGMVDSKSHGSWHERFYQYEKKEHERLITSRPQDNNLPLRMSDVIFQLNSREEDLLLVTDVGQHQMIACRYFQFASSRSNITSGGLGTMGFGLPAAVGAQVGASTRQVVAVVGDGGFQMTIQELGTIAHAQLPLKIIILNNSYLGMVRQWQQLFFKKRYAFTPISSPDYAKIAEGYGIHGQKVSLQGELPAALDKMFETPGPCLLEVEVDKEDNVFPMIPPGASVSEVMLEPPGQKD
ncbi:MAG: biosynthetic-type acetolactate synthase large subunit [Bacteroidales bacterium]|nr:biosynthetic-type acetolactate synthase large subunit [Bacteroidales bacterium]